MDHFHLHLSRDQESSTLPCLHPYTFVGYGNKNEGHDYDLTSIVPVGGWFLVSSLRLASELVRTPCCFLALPCALAWGAIGRSCSCIFPLVFIFAAASIYSWLLNHACSSFACLCEFEYGKPSFSVAQCPCMYGRSWVASCSVVVCGSSSWFTDLCKCSTSLLETLVCLTGPCWSSAIAYICCSSCRSPSWSRSSKYPHRHRAPISDDLLHQGIPRCSHVCSQGKATPRSVIFVMLLKYLNGAVRHPTWQYEGILVHLQECS